MQLVDSNVWLALTISTHPFHAAARNWLARRTTRDRALFCRATQLSFVRLLTTDAVMAPYGIPALSNKAAWSTYEACRTDQRVAWIAEPKDLDVQWKKLAAIPKPAPKLWMDAYLAALALAEGLELVTTDHGFTQFKGLEVQVLARV